MSGTSLEQLAIAIGIGILLLALAIADRAKRKEEYFYSEGSSLDETQGIKKYTPIDNP